MVETRFEGYIRRLQEVREAMSRLGPRDFEGELLFPIRGWVDALDLDLKRAQKWGKAPEGFVQTSGGMDGLK